MFHIDSIVIETIMDVLGKLSKKFGIIGRQEELTFLQAI